MSGKRKEIFDGIMDGAFTTRGLSIVGPPGVAEVIFYQILFNIKMHIVKIDGKFSGTYSFNAYPLLLLFSCSAKEYARQSCRRLKPLSVITNPH